MSTSILIGIVPLSISADATVWGLVRIRQGNLIRLASDETEEEWKPRAPRDYY